MDTNPNADDAVSASRPAGKDAPAQITPSPLPEPADAAIQDGQAPAFVLPKNPLAAFFAGPPVGFWFFFWGEFAERCSYYGMRAILALYMIDKLGISEADAATFNSFFIAATYFLPLVGGYVADRWFGKYWTIVGFSIPYILGHVILGVQDFWFMCGALLLLAMGSGVIKPNISTLMGLTYDQQRPGQEKLRSDGFAMFYFSINIGAAISQFAMPVIRDHFGYAMAFLFPAALMAVSFVIFAAGKPFYAKESIGFQPKTPEARAAQWTVLKRIIGLFVLVMFFWAIFDQASSTWIFFANSCMDLHMFGVEVDPDQIQAFNPVFILILLPAITVLLRVLDAKGILKLRATDKMVIGFLLTAACMGIMALSAVLAGPAELHTTGAKGDVTITRPGGVGSLSGPAKITVADGNVTVALGEKGEQKLTVEGGRLTPQGDSGVVIEGGKTTLAEGDKKAVLGDTGKFVVAGKEKTWLGFWNYHDISIARRWFIDPAKRVSVWWQVFAYLIITMAEVLISVTGLDLAYSAAPKSMTGFVTACWLVTVGMGNLIINAPITRLYPAMQPMAYFGMLAGTLLVVTVAFFFVAVQFNRVIEAPADDRFPGGDFSTRVPRRG